RTGIEAGYGRADRDATLLRLRAAGELVNSKHDGPAGPARGCELTMGKARQAMIVESCNSQPEQRKTDSGPDQMLRGDGDRGAWHRPMSDVGTRARLSIPGTASSNIVHTHATYRLRAAPGQAQRGRSEVRSSGS